MKNLLALKVFIIATCILGFSGFGVCAVTTPVVSVQATSDAQWIGAKTCTLRFATAENHAFKQGEISWLIQAYENFEGQLVVGNAVLPIAVANGDVIPVNSKVNLNNIGSFSIQFILKDGFSTDLEAFCNMNTFWEGDGFTVVIK